ncbi:MAG TPA: cytochrome c biogenesis protein ResB, partial [Dehalococcoidales bacterium]|nr:cytochrome c biogenesis protein ResB [Dehalococcoidales bacterium]
MKQIYKFLSSMHLGIVLLLTLAAISVFATTREMDWAIGHIYESWWYIGIITFTALNLLLCTVKSAGSLFRQALKPTKTAAADGISKMPVNRAIKLREQKNPVAATVAAFKKAGLNISVEEGPDGAAVVF